KAAHSRLLTRIRFLVLLLFAVSVFFCGTCFLDREPLNHWLAYEHPGNPLFVASIVLLLLSSVVSRFWCRFFCPTGALLTVLKLLSPLRLLRRNPAGKN
ncbi:MAG: 4Fe-4S binding protein, partial [Candidatus Wallbacteria bacterium]|nr:4Fe-4S binding protein [Candidatus Wallbacteria bacterium]